MTWPASGPGRLLERNGDVAPRGMTVHDRTRLNGRLRHLFLTAPTGEPAIIGVGNQAAESKYAERFILTINHDCFTCNRESDRVAEP